MSERMTITAALIFCRPTGIGSRTTGRRVTLALAVIGACAALSAGEAYAADSEVTLECKRPGLAEAGHWLLELNYAANTVRQHGINDDGDPPAQGAVDNTSPAAFSNKTITWSERWFGGPLRYFTLNRITGRLTEPTLPVDRQCQVWTAPSFKPKF